MSLVSEKGVAAGVAYVTRHHPAVQAMRQFLREQPYGNPVQIVCTGGQHFPFYRPAYRQASPSLLDCSQQKATESQDSYPNRLVVVLMETM